MLTRRRLLARLGLLGGAAALAPGCSSLPSFDRVTGALPDLSLPRFITARAESETPGRLGHIAFGSCLDQRRELAVLDTIAAERPDLFVFLGDNVYGEQDSSAASLPELTAAYGALAASPSFARLKTATPLHAIWDDHDYGKNDAGADFAFAAPSKAKFLDFWDIPPDDPRRSRTGIYRSHAYGPPGERVQVILLDTRSFRDPLRPTDERGAPGKERYMPDPDPAKTLLGADQWRWFIEQLAVPADLRLIASSIQVLADGHGWERWGNLPMERARLYGVLDRAPDVPTVFLSGDRHVAGLYRTRTPGGRALLEATSSSLNRPAGISINEPGPNRLGDLYRGANYGTVLIDWAERRIALEIRSQAGSVVRRHQARLAQLA